MFINCPYCNALVATDPASDTPPEYCPRCAAGLRTPKQEVPSGEGEWATDAPVREETPPAPDPVAAALESVEQDAIEVAGDDGDAVAREASIGDADALDADRVSEAMLGPAAIEVEFEVAGARPDAAARHALSPIEAALEEEASADPMESDALTLPESARDAATEPVPEPVVAGAATPIESRASRPAPSFVRAPGVRPAPAGKRRWHAAAAIAVLALLLVLQLLLADRADLAANARWRPWITALCGMLRCTVPPWREAEAFALLERDVRPHPTVPGALRVTASFRNDARWPQPWPRLALTLSDLDGREAGARSFTATEYLGAAPTQQQLESGQTATIAMDVIEPAPRIVAFTFEFH